jgi:hypothetical protein
MIMIYYCAKQDYWSYQFLKNYYCTVHVALHVCDISHLFAYIHSVPRTSVTWWCWCNATKKWNSGHKYEWLNEKCCWPDIIRSYTTCTHNSTGTNI